MVEDLCYQITSMDSLYYVSTMFSNTELQRGRLDLIHRIVLDHQSKGIAVSSKTKYKISLINEKFFMTSYTQKGDTIEEDISSIKQIIKDQTLCYERIVNHEYK